MTEEKKKRITVEVPDSLHQNLKILCLDERKSMREFVTEAINRHQQYYYADTSFNVDFGSDLLDMMEDARECLETSSREYNLSLHDFALYLIRQSCRRMISASRGEDK